MAPHVPPIEARPEPVEVQASQSCRGAEASFRFRPLAHPPAPMQRGLRPSLARPRTKQDARKLCAS